MSTIIAGHFQLQEEIDRARSELVGLGFADDRISEFFVNQPGQHDLTLIGGDNQQSPGCKEAPIGVLEGTAAGGALGLALGAVASVVTGPAGPIVGGLVGAHVGSLYSFHKMKEGGESEAGGENAVEPRKPGMLVAVAIDDPPQEGWVLQVLRDLGAHHIERAEGSIVDRDWVDFDPLSVPVIIA